LPKESKEIFKNSGVVLSKQEQEEELGYLNPFSTKSAALPSKNRNGPKKFGAYVI
jgi:hypothetical protein